MARALEVTQTSTRGRASSSMAFSRRDIRLPTPHHPVCKRAHYSFQAPQKQSQRSHSMTSAIDLPLLSLGWLSPYPSNVISSTFSRTSLPSVGHFFHRLMKRVKLLDSALMFMQKESISSPGSVRG